MTIEVSGNSSRGGAGGGLSDSVERAEFIHPADRRSEFAALRADTHGAADTRYNRHIEQLADLAFEAQPLLHIAGVEIDHLNAAPGVAVARLQIAIEVEPGKGFLARQRQAHHRGMAMERQTAQKARQEGMLLDAAGLAIDLAEKA